MLTRPAPRAALPAGALLLAIATAAGPALAGQPNPTPSGNHLNITEILVNDIPPGTLTIRGEHFDFGGPLAVTMAGFGLLDVLSATPSTLLVSCPRDIKNVPTCMDGDFLITVSTGIGQSQSDEYDLSIGTHGPQGPKGDTGAQGPIGNQGIQGVVGPQGGQGVVGPTGPLGPTGPAGTAGSGTQGAQGPTGPTGPTGPAGSASGKTFAICTNPGTQVPSVGNTKCLNTQPCNCNHPLSKVQGPCKATSDTGSCEGAFCADSSGGFAFGSCCVCRP